MPLIVPGKFRQFVKEMANAQRPGSPVHAAIMTGVKASLQARIKHQFAEGTGPDDRRQKPKKGRLRKPALISRRLGNAARIRASGSDVYVEPKTPHVGDILDTQQEGYTFPPRSVSARAKYFRPFENRFMSQKKYIRARKGKNVGYVETARGSLLVRQTKNRSTILGRKVMGKAHTIGPRRLPPRPIRPVGALTQPWGKALATGVESGAAKRFGKYTG